MKEAVFHTVLERHPDWIALHAAVLSSASGSVLLAGSAGRGKTTLAAVLNALGMPSLADDMALVAVRPLAMRRIALRFRCQAGQLGCPSGLVSSPGRASRISASGWAHCEIHYDRFEISEQTSTVSAVVSLPRFFNRDTAADHFSSAEA